MRAGLFHPTPDNVLPVGPPGGCCACICSHPRRRCRPPAPCCPAAICRASSHSAHPASCPQLTGVCGVSGYGASTGAGNWLVQIYRCGTSSCQVGVNLPQGKCPSHVVAVWQARSRTAPGLAVRQAAHLHPAACASCGAPLTFPPAPRLHSPCCPCRSVGQHAAEVRQRDSGAVMHTEPRGPSLLQRQLLHSKVHVLCARCVGG